MKRTPVLIDVNGVPLRESLSYHGGGAGFGGQMAEWLPPAQSADAALLPALRLGNARADDLVRNNGIAANAVAQMLAPKAKTPEYRATDNGKQNTYFSSLDNMIAQGNPMPVPYGEMLVGSRRISQDISTRDEGGGGKVVVIGRG
ncbi:TPA: phage portal protein [Escherichia coli]